MIDDSNSPKRIIQVNNHGERIDVMLTFEDPPEPKSGRSENSEISTHLLPGSGKSGPIGAKKQGSHETDENS